LEIIFNTGHYNGPVSKRPSIKTNEGAELKYVQITTSVYTNPDSTYPINISPYKFDISQFGEKTRNSLEFSITNLFDSDLEVKLVDMPLNMFKVTLPKKIKAGKVEKGKIEVLDEYLKSEFEKSITIELSDSQKTRFTIPVKRTVRIPGSGQASSPAMPGKTH
jgi:hypothetical protein